MTDYPITNSTLRRRKPLARGKPPKAKAGLERGAPQTRKTRVKARNAKRKGHRFPKLVLEHFRAWVREQPCAITRLRTGGMTCLPVVGWVKVRVDPAHVRARSLGGPDAANIIPLVDYLHRELDHQLKRRLFEEKYKVDLVVLAEQTYAQYLTEHPERAA